MMVTHAASKILDPVEFEQTPVVSNAGPDPVEVSTDPRFRYGYGIRIASGDSASVVIHVHEGLWARCAEGDAASVTIAAPPAAAAVVEQVFEVTDLTIPAGTNWSTLGRPFGQIDLVPGRGLDFRLYLEIAEATEADVVWLAVLNGPDFTLAEFAPCSVSVGSSRTVDLAHPLQPQGSDTAFDTVFAASLKYDPAFAAVQSLQTDAPPPLHVGLWTNGLTSAPITVVRARAAFLLI